MFFGALYPTTTLQCCRYSVYSECISFTTIDINMNRQEHAETKTKPVSHVFVLQICR